jgi:hypothetical protein
MSASSRAPLHVRAVRCIGTGTVLSLAAFLAACSSPQHASGPQVFAWLQPEPPAAAAVHTAYVETVDDGMAAPSPDGGAAGEDWITISQNDVPEASPGSDDGLPVPMGPEEAGVLPEPVSAGQRRVRYSRPAVSCPFNARWKCGR